MEAIEFVERHCRFLDENSNQSSFDEKPPSNPSVKVASIELEFQDQAQADDEYTSDEPQTATNLVPLEFAKQHIARIEQDMQMMHDRHVTLMREMDTNYKMIEEET